MITLKSPLPLYIVTKQKIDFIYISLEENVYIGETSNCASLFLEPVFTRKAPLSSEMKARFKQGYYKIIPFIFSIKCVLNTNSVNTVPFSNTHWIKYIYNYSYAEYILSEVNSTHEIMYLESLVYKNDKG